MADLDSAQRARCSQLSQFCCKIFISPFTCFSTPWICAHSSASALTCTETLHQKGWYFVIPQYDMIAGLPSWIAMQKSVIKYTTDHKEFGTLLGDNQNWAKIADWAGSMCNLQCGVLRMQQSTQITSRNLGKKSVRNYKGLKNATKARKFTCVTIWSMVSFCSLSLPRVSCQQGVWFDLMLPFCFKTFKPLSQM